MEPISSLQSIANYAVHEANSKGRRVEEPAPAWRSEFQRDRDRVVHSSAFRRLEYKTQVFVNHEGDMFRTRLTHSLEVAQIARAVARALRVNEDLTEAIALAHDLGHAPFGHAGQSALNACMRKCGGFEHNLQSLRVVDHLEQRYENFNGLNLLFETREGILKHCSGTQAAELGEVAMRFRSGLQPSLEAQIANLADEIAYNHHDIDDGLRFGVLTPDLLHEQQIFRDTPTVTCEKRASRDFQRSMHATIRAALGNFVDDLIKTSLERIQQSGIESLEQVRSQASPLVDFSESVRESHLRLKRFLQRELYSHEQVHRFNEAARATVTELFDYYMNEPELLPDEHQADSNNDEFELSRRVGDYIAGMTDRFAISSHSRLATHTYWPVVN